MTDTTQMRVMITGVTGMVGEGVLHECLQSAHVEKVLVLNRRACGVVHPKLTEVIVADFFTLDGLVEKLRGYNACFFCAGLSSVGLDEAEYRRLTYDLTLHFAQTLLQLNPGLTFCYISGAGTDSVQKSTLMWARVKGQTENALLAMPFDNSYMFRPGYLQPTKGLKNTKRFYYIIAWMYPILRRIFPGSMSTLRQLGQAMINVVRFGSKKRVLEVRDIVALSKHVEIIGASAKSS